MPATKIIFLDFDGPLCNHRVTAATGSMEAFDQYAIAVLRKVCDLSGAKIVCTSTRAPLYEGGRKDIVAQWFADAGMGAEYLHPDWSCRYDNTKGGRREHIARWLTEHPDCSIRDTVTIDDNFVDVPNLVQVNRYDGLMSGHFMQIMTAFVLDPQHLYKDIVRQI
ncbi:MAG: hypothetical protein JWO78_133 [Micavibrio sp.]|nr:hypothetical protein [Micavibrio sp.]